MFFSHWVKEFGLDKKLAPIDDSKHNKINDDNDEESLFTTIFDTVAPRSPPPQHNNSESTLQKTRQDMNSSSVHPMEDQIKRLQKDTTLAATPQPPTNKSNTNNELLIQYQEENTNLRNQLITLQTENTNLKQIIEENSSTITAAKQTAETANAPTWKWANISDLFTLCSAQPKPPKKDKNGNIIPPKLDENGNIIPSKNIKKIHKVLSKQRDMIKVRSFNIANVPDGYTILHAACKVGNIEVVEYLLSNHVMFIGKEEDKVSSSSEVDGEYKLDLNERDLQGRTPLHIASVNMHDELIKVLEGAYNKLKDMEMNMYDEEEDDGNSGSSDGEGGEEKKEGDDKDQVITDLVEEMVTKLTTSETSASKDDNTADKDVTITPKTVTKSPIKRRLKTPKSRSPKRSQTPKTPLSRSPKPTSGLSPKPTSRLSPQPTFAGSSVPTDLSGRSPLGMAATSTASRAKTRRSIVENMLYKPGDPSIIGHGGRGERTPPNARCGPQKQYLSPNVGSSARGGSVPTTPGSGGSIIDAGTNSYFSPTPRKNGRYTHTPGCAATANFATSFQSPPPPPTIHEESGHEEEEETAASENVLQLQWAASEANGWRVDMEDAMLVKYPVPRPLSMEGDASSSSIPTTMAVFGVFDGHGDGGHASKFIAENLVSKLQSQHKWATAYHNCNRSSDDTLSSVLTQTCLDLDEDLKNDESKPKDGGSTAIMALVSNRVMYVANIGDARCILVRKKNKNDSNTWDPSSIEVIAMSEDHKPDLPGERSRIESAGLSVQTDHIPPDEDDENGEYTKVHRVKKSDTELLGVSRAFGDQDYKSNKDLSASRQAVTCSPDIRVRDRADDEDMYLILACDGVSISIIRCLLRFRSDLLLISILFRLSTLQIWDVMSNEEVGEFVARRVAEQFGWVDELSNDTNEEQSELKASKERNMSDNTVEGEVLAKVGDDLLAKCLDKNSRDNMSVLIVALPASGIVTNDSAATHAVVKEPGNVKRTLEYDK